LTTHNDLAVAKASSEALKLALDQYLGLEITQNCSIKQSRRLASTYNRAYKASS
jgi:hypothetical protein